MMDIYKGGWICPAYITGNIDTAYSSQADRLDFSFLGRRVMWMNDMILAATSCRIVVSRDQPVKEMAMYKSISNTTLLAFGDIF